MNGREAVDAALRGARKASHNTIDFGTPPRAPFLVVYSDRGDTEAIRDAVFVALSAPQRAEGTEGLRVGIPCGACFHPRHERGRQCAVPAGDGFPCQCFFPIEPEGAALRAESKADPLPVDGLDVERLAAVLAVSPIAWTVRSASGAWVMTRMFDTADEAAEYIADKYARLAASEDSDGPR